MRGQTGVKPIETEYNGYRFRSRLEARWAVFFDAIGAKWEYEPEGFQLKDGTRYLPDFLLHGVRGRGANEVGDIYIEIKGVLTQEDLHKIEMFPMPIIIFGQIPDATWKEGFYSDGTHYAYWAFDYNKDDNDNFYNLLYSEGDDYWTEPVAGKGGGLVLDYPDNPYDFVDGGLTAEAYKAARQARFEHGEHGKSNKKPGRINDAYDELVKAFGPKAPEKLIEKIKREKPSLFGVGLELVRAVRGNRVSVEFYANRFMKECAEMGLDYYKTYKAFSEEI